MAERMLIDAVTLKNTLRQTVFKNANDEEFAALIMVANVYDLNPILKEIYAFPGKTGGIVPIVSVDGWNKMVIRQESFDGVQFHMEFDDKGKPWACTCKIFVKNRQYPCEVTEYYDECYRKTDPWDKMPRRMLRHKALIQCARVAFGLAGVYDEDEGRDIINITATATPQPPNFIGPPEGAELKTSPPPANVIKVDPKQDKPNGHSPEIPPETPPQEERHPEDEPQHESDPQVETPPFYVPNTTGLADLTGKPLLDLMKDTLDKSGIQETQLNGWLDKNKQFGRGQTKWQELSEGKLRNLLNKWADLGPTIKEIPAS